MLVAVWVCQARAGNSIVKKKEFVAKFLVESKEFQNDKEKKKEKEGTSKRWEGGSFSLEIGSFSWHFGGEIVTIEGEGVTMTGVARWGGDILQFWKGQRQGKDCGHLSLSLRKSICVIGDAGCGYVGRYCPNVTLAQSLSQIIKHDRHQEPAPPRMHRKRS